MANNPPPYSNITGITRAVMKDNAQTSLVNYDGNARPGEIVVNQSDYSMWIGNTQGDLNQAPILNAGTSTPPAAYLGGFYLNVDGGELSGEGLYFCANVSVGWQKVTLT
jgi:hypothetical protein